MKLWGGGGQPGPRGWLRSGSWLLAYIALAALDRVLALRLESSVPGLADGVLARSWWGSESLRFNWQLALAVLILLQQDRWRHAALWCLALTGAELGLCLIERAPVGLGGMAWDSIWGTLGAVADGTASPWPQALQVPVQAALMLGLARACRWPWIRPAARSHLGHGLQRAGLLALGAAVSQLLLMGEGVGLLALLLSMSAQALAFSLSWAWLAAWLRPTESNPREGLQLAALAAVGVALSVACGCLWQREQALDQRQQLEAQAAQATMAVQAQAQAVEQQLRLLRLVLVDAAGPGEGGMQPLVRGMLDANPFLQAFLWQAPAQGPAQGLRPASTRVDPPIRVVAAAPGAAPSALPVPAWASSWERLWAGAGADALRWLPAGEPAVSNAWVLLRAGKQPGAAWLAAGLDWERILEAAALRPAPSGPAVAELHLQVSESTGGLRAFWPQRDRQESATLRGPSSPSPSARGAWALWGQAQYWQRSMELPGAGASLRLRLSATPSPWRESSLVHAPPASGFAVFGIGLLFTAGLQLALQLAQQRRRRQSMFGQERQLDLEQSLLMLDYSLQQFHRQSEQLHALLDVTPVGYAAFDAPGQGLYSNKAFAALGGSDVEAPTPSLPSVLRQLAGRASPATVAAELQALARSLEAEPVAPLVGDGPARVLRMVLSPAVAGQGGGQDEARELELRLLSFEQGAIASVLLLLDVSDEQRLERSKAQFINNAAHEIRTPLTVILGSAELLLALPSAAEADEIRRQCSADILRKAQELQHLVRGLLDLSELDAQGVRSLRCQAIEPVSWLQQLCLRYSPPASAAALEFQTELEPASGLRLWLDPRKMERALQHLLANAYEFSPPGSPVCLTLSELPTPVGHPLGGRWLAIAVHDQGMGMSADQVAHAFDRFYRADHSGSRPGFGLGLSYVRRLLELQGGQVHIDSAPQQGCVVRLWLSAMKTPDMGEV